MFVLAIYIYINIYVYVYILKIMMMIIIISIVMKSFVLFVLYMVFYATKLKKVTRSLKFTRRTGTFSFLKNNNDDSNIMLITITTTKT